MKAAVSPRAIASRVLPLAAVVVSASVLAGCSGGKGRTVCPGAVVAPDVDRVAQFAAAGGGIGDVVAAAKIDAVANRCSSEKDGVAVNTHISFVLLRTNVDVKQTDFPYFVAVVDANRNILNEKVFRLRQEFVPRQNSRNVAEDITEHIHLATPAEGGNYAIIVGFRLTPEQLEFNRKQRGE
jgi:hypothetical protein